MDLDKQVTRVSVRTMNTFSRLQHKTLANKLMMPKKMKMSKNQRTLLRTISFIINLKMIKESQEKKMKNSTKESKMKS